MLTVHQLTVGSLEENTYAVVNKAGQALLIDPGADAPKILDWIESKGWAPQAILLTHAHHDHIGAVDAVRDRYGIPLYMHPVESGFLNQPELNLSAYLGQPFTARPAEVLWEDLGDKEVAGFHFKVVFVPGHSPGHVAYIFTEDHFVLSGDTIFAQSIGRTDLPGGSYIELMQSIHRELIQLPEDYVLYPGHGPAVTVGESLATNPYFEVFRNLFKHRFEE